MDQDQELGNVFLTNHEDGSVQDDLLDPGEKDMDQRTEIESECVDHPTDGDNIYRVNWNMIKEEFSIDALWNLRKSSEIGTTATKNFFLGLSSFFDLSSDIKVFFDYLKGTVYTKTVDIMDHEYVNSTNCTLNYRTSVDSWIGNEWKEESLDYTYSCFEQDPAFAWFTFTFIFLWPGLFWGFGLFSLLCNCKSWVKVVVLFCFPLIMASYPIVLVIMKIMAIFHNGKIFKMGNSNMSALEGKHEASPQLCVQIFIILSRGDRYPTPFQWFTIATSAIGFNIPQIEIFNRTKTPPSGTKEEILRIVKLFPLFLITSLFRILSIAIVCVLLKYYAVIFYGCLFMIAHFLLGSFPAIRHLRFNFVMNIFTIKPLTSKNFESKYFKKLSYTELQKEKVKSCNRKLHMLFWFTVNTTILLCVLILANTSDVAFHVFGVLHSWSSLPIIANIIWFNTLLTSTIFCGVISLVIFYLQIEKETTKVYHHSNFIRSQQEYFSLKNPHFYVKMTEKDIKDIVSSILEDLLEKVYISTYQKRKQPLETTTMNIGWGCGGRKAESDDEEGGIIPQRARS